MQTRRQLIGASLALPFLSFAERAEAEEVLKLEDEALPPPKFTLAINLEIMFPGSMPYDERIELSAKAGAKHYAFWSPEEKNHDAMRKMQDKHKLTCVSITGNPKTGWTTGLTQTGEEQKFLDDFEHRCKVANLFGVQNLITFVGAVQKDIPQEVQDAQIIAGLKKAGAIAERYDVYLTLEPLNRVESPQMSMITSYDAYRYAMSASHPRIKVDYDMYHRQLGEGNVIQRMETGLKEGHVRFLEVGDVPGRKEAGSGEMNYANIFKFLRKVGYSGFIGMEHGTTKTPKYAWEVTRKLAGF